MFEEWIFIVFWALLGMFAKPKFTPGVPDEVQRVYDMLSPKPKVLYFVILVWLAL